MTNDRPLITSGPLARLLAGELDGPDDLPVAGFATLEAAAPTDLTYIRSPRYAAGWAASNAAVAIVTRGIDIPGHDPANRALIRVDDADLALVKVLETVAAQRAAATRPAPGVHPAAVVAADAAVDPTAAIGPGCVIQPGARVGPGVVLQSSVYLGHGVRVGDDTTIGHAAALLPGTVLGRRCIIHPSAVLGADGFGYRPGPADRPPVKIPHVGGVRVGDDVEIGAGTAIDRGKFGDTVIGDGTKIDNLVQIGHNVAIGRGVIICGAAAVGGSTTIGDGATLGGACAVPDNVAVAPGAVLAGGAFVIGNIPAGEPHVGMPARPASEFKRNYANTRLIGRLKDRIKDLAARLDRLEKAARP